MVGTELGLLMFGGWTVDFGARRFLADTWLYDTATEQWAPAAAGPSPRSQFALATRQTWLYDENTDRWERLITKDDPGPIGDHAMAYNPGDEAIYLFGGGTDVLSLDGFGDLSAELWKLGGDTWQRVTP